MKRTLSTVAGLVLACSGVAASRAQGSQEPEYRASEVCLGTWANETTGRQRRLVVHAIDPLGEVLPGASVTVEQSGKKVAGPDTNVAGHAVVEGLTADDGRLRVELEGFQSVEVAVRLRPGCVTAIMVPMFPGRLDNTDPPPTRPNRP